jgi:hypothetical protein
MRLGSRRAFRIALGELVPTPGDHTGTQIWLWSAQTGREFLSESSCSQFLVNTPSASHSAISAVAKIHQGALAVMSIATRAIPNAVDAIV